MACSGSPAGPNEVKNWSASSSLSSRKLSTPPFPVGSVRSSGSLPPYV
jgi:hypothetical protein